MDQFVIAMFAVGIFGIVALGWCINEERKSRRRPMNIHSGPDNVETRARRAF